MSSFNSRHRSLGGAASRGARCLRKAKMVLLLLGWCSVSFAAHRGPACTDDTGRVARRQHFNLADDKGKVVIVNMWATWCAPCREEMPALDAYYRRHRDQGLVLIALSMDDPKDEAKVREVTKAYSFPVGLAHDTYLNGYGRIWRLPLTFVVDRRGILRKDQWYGDPGLDAPLLEQTVTPLLRAP